LKQTKLERFDATQIENYNTLEYTIADARYAVSHHSDVYSSTAIAGVSVLVSALVTVIVVTIAIAVSTAVPL